MGDIRIDNVNGTGLKNGGTFTNSANIIIGANTVVPFIQAFSSGLYQEDNGTFKNINCTGVLTTYDKIYDYFNRINNLGEVIIEYSNWNSTINSNSGVVQYLNGGLFTIRRGQIRFLIFVQLLQRHVAPSTAQSLLSVCD